MWFHVFCLFVALLRSLIACFSLIARLRVCLHVPGSIVANHMCIIAGTGSKVVVLQITQLKHRVPAGMKFGHQQFSWGECG